jgi:hypothetical protein
MSNPKFTGWRKSRRSGAGNGNCVEIAFAADGNVGLRDSKNQAGPVLEFDPSAWAAFLGGVRDGDFDQPLPSRFPG